MMNFMLMLLSKLVKEALQLRGECISGEVGRSVQDNCPDCAPLLVGGGTKVF
jgi:hypothetical protein